jgi:hypothetical protein
MELIARLTLVGILLAASGHQAHSAARPQDPPADFAVVLKFGLCTSDTLDTYRRVFVRDLGRTEPAVSIALELPSATLRAIHREILAARFHEFPEEFRISGSSAFAPAMSYDLTARMSGATHRVAWRDSIRPSTPAADRLRSMFDRVIQLVTEHPTVKELPRARIGCGDN